MPASRSEGESVYWFQHNAPSFTSPISALRLPDDVDRDLDRRGRPAVLEPMAGVPVFGPADARPVLGEDTVSMVGDRSLQDVDRSGSPDVVVDGSEDAARLDRDHPGAEDAPRHAVHLPLEVDRREQLDGDASRVGYRGVSHRMTRLTSLPPPATTIRSGALPSRIARIRSRARTAASISAGLASAGTMTLSSSLPLTWTGISRVASTTAAGSISGHISVCMDDQVTPASARRLLHSSSVMWGADGASISSNSLMASSHSGPPATTGPR